MVLTKNYRFTDELGDIAVFYRKNYLTEEAIIERGDFKELNLAYENTIHCFQGKTLSKGKLYITMANLFERSMFYVAISHVLRKDQIVLVDLFA